MPIPSYVQDDITKAPLSRKGSGTEDALLKNEEGMPPRQRVLQEQLALPTHFTVYNSADSILHTPEAAFKEGLGMVKVIKENLKALELGSKLRREVWDREIAKQVTFS